MSKLSDVLKQGLRSAQPAASAVGTGTLYFVTDEQVLEQSDGSAWSSYSNSLQLMKRPVSGDFSWTNQGSASIVANSNGGIFMQIPGAAGTNYRFRQKATPATPYTVTAAFRWTGPVTDFHQFGLILSDGTKLTTYFIACVASISAHLPLFMSQDFTNVTTFSANNLASATNKIVPSSPIWMRLADDGANKVWSYSPDGINFITLLSEARTTHLTPTQIGFGGETENATSQDLGFELVSWKET
jgi:hypothetical protein